MSVARNQREIFLHLLGNLRPHWRRDPALPARIQALLTRNRRFGARDRRLYRELLYTTLRHLPWIEPLLDADTDEAVRRVAWLAAETPATQPFRAAFATGESPVGDQAELLPSWFRAHCAEIFSGAELAAQLRRAPLWLRLQTKEPRRVFEEFDAAGWRWRQSSALSSAIEILAEVDVTKTRSWEEGGVEVQDLGSQLVLSTLEVSPGGKWLDACAGAGGKTLQLAALLGGAGRIDAHDIRPEALRQLQLRATRAGMTVAALPDGRSETRETHVPPAPTIDAATLSIIRHLPAGAQYDGVLVDAPCSGSGTWRRSPHLKWTTTEATLARLAALQSELLEKLSPFVRPGGRLIYVTCSLSSCENEAVVAAFLQAHPEFHPAAFARAFGATPRGAGLLILPSRHDTDGFFIAALDRDFNP